MHSLNLLLAALTLVAPVWSQDVTAPPSGGPPTATGPPCAATSLMPACGIPCIIEAANEVGCTVPMDFACHCSHGPAMQAAAMPCVSSACGPDGAKVGAAMGAICSECVATPTAAATPAA
ncbi:hypothetical protein QBC34DRAFT_420555 [Podospora aff. communis PSN243]|uniref:CFEM domain-containing protein n=1 Tax=Podospora aff. communis PSN243 TaxID=3040156 RepID=A0AAV9H3R9_9PEZI|nr:hypothetical protein QBC34DRAFT_420555 [Podospora aff. communis PSN243]